MDEDKSQAQILADKQDILSTEQDLVGCVLRLSKRIDDMRQDMIKWLFIFWITQVLVTFGFIWLFLKK
jgi:hypothetical protein